MGHCLGLMHSASMNLSIGEKILNSATDKQEFKILDSPNLSYSLSIIRKGNSVYEDKK